MIVSRPCPAKDTSEFALVAAWNRKRRTVSMPTSSPPAASSSTAPPRASPNSPNPSRVRPVSLAWRSSHGYTQGMKTAVSIPDDVFEGAERLARRTNRSRSRLFSDALKEYLARHTPDKVTEAMNGTLAQIGALEGEGKDSFVSSAARTVLERSEW